MEDMSNKDNVWETLLQIVQDAKGMDPVVQDMSSQCSWGDYMIVVTAGSQTHMRGIYHRLMDYVKTQDVLMLHNHPGTKEETRWILMDLGAVVIHIMTEEAREYYSLEDVWFESPVLFRDQSHSSSSS
jgi:ribosome-associated protein